MRYIGIDAPESVRPDSPVEPFGIEASAANAALVGGRSVLLERDVSDRDRFGRLLRYVWLETPDRPLFVNFELVARGFATAVTFPPDVRHVDLLRAAEREARARSPRALVGRGIGEPGADRRLRARRRERRGSRPHPYTPRHGRGRAARPGSRRSRDRLRRRPPRAAHDRRAAPSPRGGRRDRAQRDTGLEAALGDVPIVRGDARSEAVLRAAGIDDGTRDRPHRRRRPRQRPRGTRGAGAAAGHPDRRAPVRPGARRHLGELVTNAVALSSSALAAPGFVSAALDGETRRPVRARRPTARVAPERRPGWRTAPHGGQRRGSTTARASRFRSRGFTPTGRWRCCPTPAPAVPGLIVVDALDAGAGQRPRHVADGGLDAGSPCAAGGRRAAGAPPPALVAGSTAREPGRSCCSCWPTLSACTSTSSPGLSPDRRRVVRRHAPHRRERRRRRHRPGDTPRRRSRSTASA